MCGFVSAFEVTQDLASMRKQVLKMAKKVRHRGPDWSGIYCEGKTIMAHERLSIVDIASGGQPQYSKNKDLILAVNGEIYNHQEIRKRHQDLYEFQSNSDCEVILSLYAEKGAALFEDLSGI